MEWLKEWQSLIAAIVAATAAIITARLNRTVKVESPANVSASHGAKPTAVTAEPTASAPANTATPKGHSYKAAKATLIGLIAVLLLALAMKDDEASKCFRNAQGAWEQGDYEKAIAYYSAAIKLRPDYVEAYNGRGVAWAAEGNYGAALVDLDQALQLEPNTDYAHNNIAWIQATCPDERYRDGRQAVLNAKRACELAHEQQWDYVETLAAAYAQNGDFEQAISLQTKAVELEPQPERQRLCLRLELYKRGIPYREVLRLPPPPILLGPWRNP